MIYVDADKVDERDFPALLAAARATVKAWAAEDVQWERSMMPMQLRQHYLKRFRDDETLTPELILAAQIQRLMNEGWRWGYEKNDQLKTHPFMTVTPLAVEFLSELEIIHQEATMSTQRPSPDDPMPMPAPEPDDPTEPDDDEDEDSEGDVAKLKQIRE